MHLPRVALLPVLFVLATSARAENAVFRGLVEEGIAMSDGTVVKLPSPILADGLDAARQRATLGEAAGDSVEELVQDSYYAPVAVKVRTVKASEGEGPAIRTLDAWFVAHGRWDVMVSKEFLESGMQAKDEGKSRVVLHAGTLTDRQMADRKLAVTDSDRNEERFVYTTFLLFERVELSATRFSVLTRGEDSIVVAGRIDPRFDADKEFPNQWRPLLRDERAEIKPGPAQVLAHAGGYAKITRLLDPADAVFVEFHLAYEESYGWFDGANLVKQKVPAIVKEKVKTFRRKLATASEQQAEKKPN